MKSPDPAILIAPNAYKGFLSSLEAAELFYEKMSYHFDVSQLIKYPLSDGGDGFLDCLRYHFGYDCRCIKMEDIAGHERCISYLTPSNNSHTAFIELAEVSGIKHLNELKRDPEKNMLESLGILIKKLCELGHNNLKIGLGGSATNDCGIGILKGLDFLILDSNGKCLNDSCNTLEMLLRVNSIVYPHKYKHKDKDKYDKLSITLFSDVDNPLFGENGCTRVFGSQKGIEEAKFSIWERAHRNYLRVLSESFGKACKDSIFYGAAGGAGVTLYYLFNAVFYSGSSLFINRRFKRKFKQCNYIISGEGRIDKSSFMKKATGEIIRMSDEYNKKLIMIVGRSDGELSNNNISVLENEREIFSKDDAIKELSKNLKKAILSIKGN